MLTYKCAWYGSELVVAGRWFASSKTCSRCGEARNDLQLGDRLFTCPGCGLALDRDLNAAINLAGWVHPDVSSHVGSPTMVAVSAPEPENACPRGAQTAHSAARLDDAGTAIAPEPAGLTGGRQKRDVPNVPS